MERIERIILDDNGEFACLEFINGLGVWEAAPVLTHQRKVDAIRASIRSADPNKSTDCVHYSDVLVAFPGGSLKRPDISIFCREPDEQDTAITLLPEAVVEVLNMNWKLKDLSIGLPMYQRVGVKDIVLFDPEHNAVLHWVGTEDARNYESPVTLTLQCGCVCTV